MEIGIVGLPNVGKSTLFNALLKKQVALAANYPFATIEPNTGIVDVPDARLEALKGFIEKSEGLDKGFKTIPATIKFIDIAGIVKGASEGLGLGNKFLSHIREVDAIAQVVREFSDADVIHTGENPKSDIETINTELILADMDTMNKLIDNATTDLKRITMDKATTQIRIDALKRIKESLDAGKLASETKITDEEKNALGNLPLITTKPMIYVYNVDETQASRESTYANELIISAQIESELGNLDEEESKEYLESLGLKQSGLHRLALKAYQILGLQSFLTAGPKEVRAWTISKGTKAPKAAAVIHTDFEKGFIKAETINWEKLIEAGSYVKARENGWLRIEGKEYIVQDGDVIEFKVNA
ncbi:MAG: redox-regulated ATPase YchF [bacterium]|nr:redox-regulated ATPase YchF [bacterium]